MLTLYNSFTITSLQSVFVTALAAKDVAEFTSAVHM